MVRQPAKEETRSVPGVTKAKAKMSYKMTMWSGNIAKCLHEALQVGMERRLVDRAVGEKLETPEAAVGTRTHRRPK